MSAPETSSLADLLAEPPRRSDWGGWQLDHGYLVAPNGFWSYAVERCTTSAKVLDLVCQVAGKGWATDQVIAGLVPRARRPDRTAGDLVQPRPVPRAIHGRHPPTRRGGRCVANLTEAADLARQAEKASAAPGRLCDVAGPTERSRQLAAEADNPLDRELWLTYVALGELLDSGRTDEDYPAECLDLVNRLAVLGKEGDRVYGQARAAWIDRTSRGVE